MALPEPGDYTVTRQDGITLTYTDFDAEDMAYDVNIHIPNGQSIEVLPGGNPPHHRFIKYGDRSDIKITAADTQFITKVPVVVPVSAPNPGAAGGRRRSKKSRRRQKRRQSRRKI
jgi:hypothetical protein